ncbi:biotin--[acetyl-CoA-carboxylase] ligase BPL1 [Aspergillus clavatus NRRL 1]|uniref:Biotin apo-protein ligase, putative n=1 Tax=Aspergillus clavatus (strain ATCC 1007 / CBS 513.65 / DSM 816 / NCTC 3887 / NRRL 1 / QM 1276 / 107) TaxID=344612 RepID=A1CT09_ASPCL|nr:biotin apo-protein ligase, putative [Aspergillus clavatus NRRL 1]EAW06446.1 biotin apo-protein ligase, putative [Aspergillus clavatus NRRL 1]
MTEATPNLTGKKLNVLVYAGSLSQSAWRTRLTDDSAFTPGNGTTVESVRHCLYTLRRLLAPHYAVIPVTADMLVKEPWTATCALLVVPGGADLGYCRALNGAGNRRIEQFVKRGGAYLGFCAGGYYGSQRCEFEVGDKTMEVVGDRELAFFPGVCRGGAFPGFVYHSEAGARAVELKVAKDALTAGVVPDGFRCYYNGGGVFVDARLYGEKGVEVLASYTEELNVHPGTGAAAVVYCKVGEGRAIVTGPHPEFAAANLDKKAGGPEYAKVVDALAADDKARTDFLKACLSKLGLQVTQSTTTVPSLSSLHLSSLDPADTTRIRSSLQELITADGDEEYIKDENDTFRLEKSGSGTWGMGTLGEALPVSETSGDEGIVDYNAVIKPLVIHEELPPSKATPYFNHHAFYANLEHYQSQMREGAGEFGSSILYGEVVTSTNTILEKNPKLLRKLPQGFTATATTQVAGRGRGSNVWVSPAGSLMFSTVVRHPIEKIQSAPVVFLQYLAAMAVVRGIKSYDVGFESMPVKLKWPNDIYALDPDNPDKKQYSKICGILINSLFSSNEYIAVVGIGINATNASPTTSLNALAARFVSKRSAPITLEKLLARCLTTFEELYTRFLRTGFDREFEEMYYDDWLHMHQTVTLEEEGGARARIKGITRDYGLLLAEELGWDDRPTGRVWQLQSDSNSFDFFRGLVKRKA